MPRKGGHKEEENVKKGKNCFVKKIKKSFIKQM